MLTLAQFNGIAWTFTGIAIALSISRFVVRYMHTGRLGWDDFFHGCGMAFLVAFTALWGRAAKQMYFTLPSEQAQDQSVINIAAGWDIVQYDVLYWLTLFSVKASFLVLFWRLFERLPVFRTWWFAAAGYTALSFLIAFLSVFWSCGKPTQISDPEACSSETAIQQTTNILFMSCAFHFLGDILLLAMPLAMLKHLHIPRAEKFAIGLIFALSFSSLLMAVTFLVFSYTPSLVKDVDVQILTGIIEPALAVIACSLPYNRALIPTRRSAQYKQSGENAIRFLDSFRIRTSTRRQSVLPTDLDAVKAESLHSVPKTPNVTTMEVDLEKATATVTCVNE